MPLADDTQAEIDLLAGTAELRRELAEAHTSAARSAAELLEANYQLAMLPKIAAEHEQQIALLTHQRDTWQRMAETAARSVHDLTAARDAWMATAQEGGKLITELTAARDAALAQAAEFLGERQEAMAKAMEAMAARDAALDQVRAMAQPSHIQTSPEAHAQELAKIQAAIPHRNRVDVHADFPAEALRHGDGIPR